MRLRLAGDSTARYLPLVPGIAPSERQHTMPTAGAPTTATANPPSSTPLLPYGVLGPDGRWLAGVDNQKPHWSTTKLGARPFMSAVDAWTAVTEFHADVRVIGPIQVQPLHPADGEHVVLERCTRCKVTGRVKDNTNGKLYGCPWCASHGVRAIFALTTVQRVDDPHVHLVRTTTTLRFPGKLLCGLEYLGSDQPRFSVGCRAPGPQVDVEPCDGCVTTAAKTFPQLPVAGVDGGPAIAARLGVPSIERARPLRCHREVVDACTTVRNRRLEPGLELLLPAGDLPEHLPEVLRKLAGLYREIPKLDSDPTATAPAVDQPVTSPEQVARLLEALAAAEDVRTGGDVPTGAQHDVRFDQAIDEFIRRLNRVPADDIARACALYHQITLRLIRNRAVPQYAVAVVNRIRMGYNTALR